MTKNLKDTEIIEKVVREFYKKAINDVFIGYHFRKILTKLEDINNIQNNLGPFESHIPNVVDFWSRQLITDYKSQINRPNILKIHEYLNIRKGELGRWLTLFRENLETFINNAQNEDETILLNNWVQKIAQFEAAFNKYYFTN